MEYLSNTILQDLLTKFPEGTFEQGKLMNAFHLPCSFRREIYINCLGMSIISFRKERARSKAA
jgi:hypothetical protein